jgi:hypothetical protein
MFSSIRKAQILIPFFNQRLADYAALARLDLITFRNEMIAAIVGAAVGVAALLLLLGFVCVAEQGPLPRQGVRVYGVHECAIEIKDEGFHRVSCDAGMAAK